MINGIESIVRKNYQGNSHYFSQMLFSVGLASTPDPLASIDIQKCQEIILKEWTVEKIVSDFRESFNASDAEYLEAWFCETTPDTYGKELLSRCEEVKIKEQEVVKATREVFKGKGINEGVIENALQIFQSSQGGGLKIYLAQRRLTDEEVFKRLDSAMTPEDIKAAEDFQNAEREPDRLKLTSLQERSNKIREMNPETRIEHEQELLAINKEKGTLQMKIAGIKREFEMLKSLAENKVQLRKLLSVQGAPFSTEDFDFIIAEKKNFDKQVLALAEEESIDFTAKETGLPSRALERARRQAYAAQFFSASAGADAGPPKINAQGSAKILASLGVIETPREQRLKSKETV